MMKKGQAAMEYLMTYGWAILVIVIVLAALWYLGVFNVVTRVPEQCSFPPEAQCAATKVTTNGSLIFDLTNVGFAKSITVTGVACTADTSKDAGTVNYTTTSTQIAIGKTQTFTAANGIDCKDASNADVTLGAAGDTYKSKIYVRYYLGSDTPTLRYIGADLVARLQP